MSAIYMSLFRTSEDGHLMRRIAGPKRGKVDFVGGSVRCNVSFPMDYSSPYPQQLLVALTRSPDGLSPGNFQPVGEKSWIKGDSITGSIIFRLADAMWL